MPHSPVQYIQSQPVQQITNKEIKAINRMTIKNIGIALSLCMTPYLTHAQAIHVGTPTQEDFFSWAERSFSEVFPSGPSNQVFTPYIFRSYSTGNYLGLTADRVFALGPITGNQLLDLGLISQFTCQITPNASSCSTTPTRPPTSLVTDTGIPSDRCLQAASTAEFVSCTSTSAIKKQDGALGLDVDSPDNSDGSLGFKYAVYEKDGRSYTKEECVLDKNTGLLWEGKVNDVLNFRHYGIIYTYYTSTTIQQKEFCTTVNSLYTCVKSTPTQVDIDSTSNATTYVNKINEIGLCGKRDWRIPSWQELHSLVHYGKSRRDSTSTSTDIPRIDTTWFPNTKAANYISSSPQASSDRSTWQVDFGVDGGADSSYSRSNSSGAIDRNYLRLVSGTPTNYNSSSRYSFNANGSEVTDSTTGLTWKRCAEGMSWDGSICNGTAAVFSAVSALTHAASNTGWKVPNLKELASIIDDTRSYPSINLTAFPATPRPGPNGVGFFITSTPTFSHSFQTNYLIASPSTPFLRTIEFGWGGFQSASPGAHLRLVKE